MNIAEARILVLLAIALYLFRVHRATEDCSNLDSSSTHPRGVSMLARSPKLAREEYAFIMTPFSRELAEVVIPLLPSSSLVRHPNESR
jgi:hypothetical protein